MKWRAHSYFVKANTARFVALHICDEIGAPYCGEPAGDCSSTLGSGPGDYNPQYTALACVECLLISAEKIAELTPGST